MCEEKVIVRDDSWNGRKYVEKHVSAESERVYRFLYENPGPFTPEIYEIQEQDEELIVREEWIDGKTLEEMTFTEQEAVQVIISLCDALKPLHGHDPAIILRDIKAENVMITKDGQMKIIDFDIARFYTKGQTRDTRLLGTQDYAAPEQFGYRQSDARTDIYALGVLLNYLILKRFPKEQIVDGPIGRIVSKCTRMEPDQRYQTVDELKKALSTASGQQKKESFLPPGFRTKTWWKMLIAVVGYGLLIVCNLMVEVTDIAILEHFEQCMFILGQLLWIFVMFNYRGIRDRIPLLRSKNLLIRGIMGAVLFVVLLYIAALFCVTAEWIVGV